jgi:N-acetylneuraminic acid mutarotase
MSRSHSRIAVPTLAALLLGSCARDPAQRLTETYPVAAEKILASDGFARSGDGYLPKAPRSTAAGSSASERGGLVLRLPVNAADAAIFTGQGSVEVQVRERGASGRATAVGAALAYDRSGGTSYWAATASGFEEWIEVEQATDAPVAEWEVAGAALRQAGDAVEVLDGTGAPILRVTAPAAYRPGGSTARAWLRVAGNVLALHTDARGPALVDPSWTTVGNLPNARRYHTSTLLFTGKVLVAGGNTGGTTATSSAAIYDSTAGTWTSTTGAMAAARYRHTATLLKDGRVLVVGGTADGTNAVNSAELYDPATGTWSAAGSLGTARQNHTATLLANGQVLVVGGANAGTAQSSAELYTPSTGPGTWAPSSSLATARQNHTATLLADGRVVVAGGANGTGVLGSIEVLGSGSWSTQTATLTPRQNHAAVLLGTGQVLFAGGLGANDVVLQTAQAWSPGAASFTNSTMSQARQQFPAVLLPSGSVLAIGGFSAAAADPTASTLVEQYDTAAGIWSAALPLTTARGASTATILPSGRVLVAGGSDGATVLGTTAVYDATNVGSFVTTGLMPDELAGGGQAGREFHTATLLQGGRVLVAGGSRTGAPVRSITPLNTTALFTPGATPAAGTWVAGPTFNGVRTFHTATLLPDGRVLLAGGYDNGDDPLDTARLFNPAGAGSWSAAGSLATARYWHTATLLPTGKVLVAGGSNQSNPANPQLPTTALGTSELYDPVTNSWSPTGSFPAGRARWGHTATLMQDGKVLVVGGSAGGASLQTADVYDPATGTWTATVGPPTAARRFHSAVLLADGRVLIIGGLGTSALNTTELYDPGTGMFRATTGTLAQARYRSQGVLLQSGLVLMVGGTSGTATALATAQLYDPATDTWSNTSNNMSSVRHGMSFTLLQSGMALAAGGDVNLTENQTNTPTRTCDIYDVGQAPLAAAIPTTTSAGSNYPGGSITVTGTLFTGISEGSGGGTASSPTNYPLVELTAAGTNAVIYAAVTTYTSTALSATLPATAQPGPYQLRVVVNGVRSAAAPMTILPYQPLAIAPMTADVFPLGTLQFTATGGNGHYGWTVSTNNSGGSITSGGLYTAGTNGGTSSVTDVVTLTDTLNNSVTATVTVGPGVSMSPTTVSLFPLQSQTFTAAGGDGEYTWTVSTNNSNGSITSDGVYTAGVAGGTLGATDVVQVEDSLGNFATATVTIGAGISISPATVSLPPRGSQTFTASGGSGLGYSWSLPTNNSGGSIDPSTGAYLAGPTPSVTDVVQVIDSLGNTATQSVAIGPGITITPAGVAVRAGTTRTFTATGGSGAGYTWSLTSGESGGSIESSSGAYQAGTIAGVDVIEVTDPLGNTASTTATVSLLFAAFEFDVTSAGRGATVRATLTVYNDTEAPVTITPPLASELALTALAPQPSIDFSPSSLAPGANVRFTYALTVTGAPGESYVAATVVETSGGPTNLATTPAGTVAEVRVDWTPAAVRVPPRPGHLYLFRLEVTNDGESPVTDVEIENPQPGEFTGLDADPASCTSTDLPAVTTGADRLTFSGSLAPTASTTLCFLFADVQAVAETSYPFTVTVTRSGGTPPAVAYERSVRLDVAPPDVIFPTVLSDASGQTLVWTNPAGSLHDGVVVFRTAAPAVPPIPEDFVDYRLSPTAEVLFAEAGSSTTRTLADPSFDRIYNYRICNHDADFVYSSCSTGFWNGEGWLDSAIAPPDGWTQQLGGAIFSLPGVVPGLSVSAVTNLPSAVSMDIARGDRLSDPLPLSALPARDTPVAVLGSGRTLLFAADDGGVVTAVDVTTGVQAWQVAHGESFVAGVAGALRRFAAPAFQAVYSGDVLFLGSTTRNLVALDADTGVPLWVVDVGWPIAAPARYDASTNFLYVATDGGGVLAYDLGTSSPTQAPVAVTGWTTESASYRLACTAAIATTDLACIDNAGVVRILDKASGAPKASWMPEPAMDLTFPQTIWTVRGANAGLVVSNARRVVRLVPSGNTFTPAGEWAPAGITLSPVQVFAGDGTIYVGGSDAALHKLSLANPADTGFEEAVTVASEASTHCGTPPCPVQLQLGPPAYDVRNDLFLFGTDDGRLWAVKTF